jgi:hypothetical protein
MLGLHERQHQVEQATKRWLAYTDAYLDYRDRLDAETRELCDSLILKIKDNHALANEYVKVVGAIISTELLDFGGTK